MTDNIKEITVKGFIETSFVDWVGNVTSVIFLPFCNFRCPYCQNAELVLDPNSLASFDIDEILKRLSKYSDWIDGVCITGGEPTIHEGLPDCIRYIKENSPLAVKIDTNGTNPKMLEKLLSEGLLAAIAMDVKAPLDDIRYYKAAGVAVDLGAIKKSIQLLMNSAIDVEFRTTITPKLFKQKDILDLAEQLKGAKRFKLQNFNKRTETIDPTYKGSDPFTEDELNGFQKQVDKIIKGTKK